MAKWVCPSVIRVAGLDFQIVFDAVKCAAENVCGCTMNKPQIIWLDPTMPEQMVRATLLHEVMHAICYQYGICNLLDSKQEEMVVNAISNGLFEIIRDGAVKF